MRRKTEVPERARLCVAFVLLLLLGTGCGNDADGTSANGGPEPATSSEVNVAEASRAFAFDLYRRVAEQEGNLFFSPYSASAALAMSWVGARGNTAEELANVLHLEGSRDAVAKAYGELDAALSSRSELPERFEGEGFTLHVVNTLWPQAGYALETAFVETLTNQFEATSVPLDFEQDPEGARKTINEQISDQTEERIQDLVPPNAIDRETRLVLTNAIYFNAPWLEPFDPEETTTEPFVRLDGTPVGSEMMHRSGPMLYANWDGGQAIEIPYNGSELAMVVLVPDAGAFEAFDQAITGERLDDIVASLETRTVTLGLPKLEFETALSLVPPLQDLGVKDAFDASNADFSGITGGRDLVISDVLHKAFVAVDEAGTEAAAATAVLFRATGIPAEPIEVIVDRPFLFVIRDRLTGSVLFIGRVVDPTA